MPITKNVVTDFGAVGNGIANDALKFADFNTWSVANQGSDQIRLTIPAGTYAFKTDDAFYWARGINDLYVTGVGNPTLKWDGGVFQLGSNGINIAGTEARLASVAAGQSAVQCLTVGEAALFTPGEWAIITGYDLQGQWQTPGGYPPNAQFFEYVKVTSANAGTGAVAFESPLRNSYLSTWPNYNEGNGGQADAGGPATLYQLPSNWNTVVEYVGLTIDAAGLQLYANGRSVTYRDVTFIGSAIPTQNKNFSAINCDYGSSHIEADKLVESVTFDTVTHTGQLDFQSASIDLFTLTNSTMHNIYGLPKRAVITNSTIDTLRPGALYYGRSEELVAQNSAIGTLDTTGGTLHKGSSDGGVNFTYTMSNGVIRVPNTNGASPWAAPGTHLSWAGLYDSELHFRVTAVTQDATYTHVYTDWPGGFPAVPLTFPDGKLYIRVHPAPRSTFTNCTGDNIVVAMSHSGLSGVPLFSYGKRTYDPPADFPFDSFDTMWGRVVSIKLNVIRAYTGVLSSLEWRLSVFNQWKTLLADASVYEYGPSLNIKIAGQRVITPSGVIGAQSGDADLAMPEALWLVGIDPAPALQDDISGEDPSTWPIISVEIITDQDTQSDDDAAPPHVLMAQVCM